MFTGLVELRAVVDQLISMPPGVRLVVRAPEIARDLQIGSSIAVNGCCLTVVQVDGVQVDGVQVDGVQVDGVQVDGETFGFDAGEETLSRTNLGRLAAGSFVNLERSLRIGDRLGGHFVTGHIDGIGVLDERIDDQEWSKFWFRVPPVLIRQMASKGSISVDGVSLTLVDVEAERFSVALIPHTLHVTTLGPMRLGDPVNLETDVLAKYVEQQLRGDALPRDATQPSGPFAQWGVDANGS